MVEHHNICLFSCPEQLKRWPCHWLTDSLTKDFTTWQKKSNPRDLWPLGHLSDDLINISTVFFLTILTIFYIFFLQFLTIFTICDNFDKVLPFGQLQRQSWRLVTFETLIKIQTIENLNSFMKIFVTWQLRVTLDSIRNSCCFVTKQEEKEQGESHIPGVEYQYQYQYQSRIPGVEYQYQYQYQYQQHFEETPWQHMESYYRDCPGQLHLAWEIRLYLSVLLRLCRSGKTHVLVMNHFKLLQWARKAIEDV